MEEGNILKKIAKAFKVDTNRMNAHQAYLKANYDRIDTDDERVKNFISKVDKIIEGKCQGGIQFCAVSLLKDLMTYKEQIISSYTTIGYNVVDVMTSDGIYVLIISWSDKYYEIDDK